MRIERGQLAAGKILIVRVLAQEYLVRRYREEEEVGVKRNSPVPSREGRQTSVNQKTFSQQHPVNFGSN